MRRGSRGRRLHGGSVVGRRATGGGSDTGSRGRSGATVAGGRGVKAPDGRGRAGSGAFGPQSLRSRSAAQRHPHCSILFSLESGAVSDRLALESSGALGDARRRTGAGIAIDDDGVRLGSSGDSSVR